MAENKIRKEVDYISPARRRGMGIFFLLVAIGIWGLFSRTSVSGEITTFMMSTSGTEIQLPGWTFNTVWVLNTLAGVTFVLGIYQLLRGFGKRMNKVLAFVVGIFVFSFLSWATSGQSMNLTGLLRNSLERAVPITLAAFAALIGERSGVTNIAVEGMMLMGAMVATLVGSMTNLWYGVLAAIISGALLAFVHAVLSIKYKTDQIISSTTILIFSTGMTSFFSARFMQNHPELNNPGFFSKIDIPVLADIPVIGEIFFSHSVFVYIMFVLLVVLHYAIFHTRWGLRLRSVGEHPKAADTLGINVIKTRYYAVVLGGMVAGFAGAYFTVGSVGRFDELMTGGKGFIGLAAMIFGNWTPIGSFGAGMLFGFADALANKLAILRIAVPSEILGMVPYLATMIVLAGVVGRGDVPAAINIPYEKE
ncbi:MAG: ABC transporter permease [Chloroflexota bacterium]